MKAPSLQCTLQFRAVLLALLVALQSALGQTDIQLQTGSHHYALENRDRNQVDRRGVAGSLGIAFNNFVLAPTTRYRAWILQAATFRPPRTSASGRCRY